ncbi:MAG TPA: heparinase II/III family protein [Haliscomenobacter sp.]|uniref:heparinase II/III domain-containing protein n=1 Tax=Haliscomenobacter sp. TaxID=2717303 RepID=UPI002C866F3D|nr:heparinase II/III family protein [Haliscomenobacter sp.]HOY19200.1 heparinase II/III family protein [Haliscomenobacter sp.]HPH17440.1 heparinase II/III family protein [Haliscomenobacter sp.]
MRTYFVLFLSLVFIHLSFAQVVQRNILANKYNLLAVQQSLIPKNQWKPYPLTPEEWRKKLPDSIFNKLIKTGETTLKYKFEPISASTSLDFVRSGDRQQHGNLSYGKRNALMNLVLAESLENQGRFTEAIMNGVWSICEESFWGVPAHISGTGLPDVENPVVDLFAAETAAVLALTDYFVGEKLDKINRLLRSRIYYETKQRIFTPMAKNGDKYGWMSQTRPVNNWNPWIMSNWITAILLLEKDEKQRAEMLHHSMRGLDRYINSLGDDGGCDEGPSYWFAAGASVYDCLELYTSATNNKVDIYREPLIQKMASYVYKTHIADNYFVNFADADPKLTPDGLMLYRFGKAINDPTMIQFGQWAFSKFPAASTAVPGYHRPRKLNNILTIVQLANNNFNYTPSSDAWFSDIQVMTSRSTNGVYLATHGGHNAESHNHNDVGDFIIYLDGKPMIVDAGRGNYTARTFSSKRYELWFTQSEYHNLPIINGFGQKAGLEFTAKNVNRVSNAKESMLTMDIASAYPAEAGIQSWNRMVKQKKSNGDVEIIDEYLLKQKPNNLQQVFMTICNVDVSEAGKIVFSDQGQVLTLQYDAKKWTASTDLPSTEGMEYSSFKTKWDSKPVRRVLLTHKAPEAKGKLEYTIKRG